MNIKNALKVLCSAPGVSGEECNASKIAKDLLAEYVNDANIDKFGTVTGSIMTSPSLPTILLDAHIDEIGMIVTFIDENGFIKVSMVGGMDRRILPAQTVTIWGLQPIKGVVCVLPPHLSEESDKAVKAEDIAIDTGFSKEALSKIVSLGDKITVDSSFDEHLNGRVSGRVLDDRSGVASILYALDILKCGKSRFNIKINFSSQEELGSRGSVIGSYNAEADYAIAVDVSYGYNKGSKEIETGKLSEGVMIGIAPSLNRQMYDELVEIAKRCEIPYQIEVMAGKTSSNADEISVSKSGVKCALLSIPERNMHTPVEMVQISDIEAVGRLVYEYIREG